MSNISKRRKEGSRAKIKSMGDHKEFLKRITKTLSYGQLPSLPCLSLPVTEISCEMWSVSQRGRSLRRLHADAAAGISRSACVSPCALVLALLYLERLKAYNPDYLATTAPADLFLVSLMVGNKFLQDDGEDDEVVCSEWAASGGLDLHQLKKLEVEFLSAIDWNVFVSEKSFEAGLLWLERQVAIKQAQLHGFFTYTELAMTSDMALLHELVQAVTTACAALALTYTTLITFLTSTLVMSNVWIPAMQYVVNTSVDTNTITYNPVPYNNTLDIPTYTFEEPVCNFRCCTKWLQHQENEKKNWYDNMVVHEWKSFEPWWSKTSILDWLYQSSLVDPMQRWLEKINEYTDFVNHKIPGQESSKLIEQCYDYTKSGAPHHCVWQRLNLSKLSALVMSVSDR